MVGSGKAPLPSVGAARPRLLTRDRRLPGVRRCRPGDRSSNAGVTTTYVRADIEEIAAALTALTGESHTLAPPPPHDERERRHS
jgi:hypothetical protein